MKIALTSKHISISNEVTIRGARAESNITWLGYAGIAAVGCAVGAISGAILQRKMMADMDRAITASYGPGSELGDAFREANEEVTKAA